MRSAAGGETRRLVVGHTLFAVAVFGISGLLAWQVVPEVLGGELVDTDNYMRLLRVERLLENGGWYDPVSPRSNAPFGETLHWTRPLDALIAMGALPLLIALPVRTAVFVSGFLVSPLLLVLICFAVGALAAEMAGPRTRYYAMIAVMAQLGVVGYAVPGRPDHHPLILLCYVVSLLLVVRSLTRPPDRWRSLATGASFGLGVWIGPEFLVPLALVTATLGLVWAVGEEGAGKKAEWFGVGLSAAIATALVLERPPADWASIEFDRLSAVHLWMGLLVLGAFGLLRRIGDGLGPGTGRRILLALAVAGGGAAAMALSFPRFFGGPTVDVDPVLLSTWLANVEEYQSFPLVGTLPGIGYLIAFLGPAILSVPVSAWLARREGGEGRAAAWSFFAFSLVLFLPLAVLRFRFAPYPELLAIPPLMALLASWHRRIEARGPGGMAPLFRAGASAVVITGSLLLGGILVNLGGVSPRVARAAQATVTRACRVTDLAPVLNDPAGLGDRTRTILTHLDFGPEILYRTGHRVVGTPYHRNTAGILDGRRILRQPVSPETRRLVEERGIDLILHCPEGSMPPGTRSPAGSSGRILLVRLQEGDLPDWITPVPLQLEESGGFMLFQVQEPLAAGRPPDS